MREVLVSLMCHPDRSPKVEVPPGEGYDAFLNRTPGYAEAFRTAIDRALREERDLVTADSDGYHPPGEIVKLATARVYAEGEALVIPYRYNIGFQSAAFSYLFSALVRRRIKDPTGGLCRMSYGLMRSLPPLKSRDMTVHIEILKHAIRSGAQIVQYGYLSGVNDVPESKRTKYYQLRLLGAALR